MAPTNERLTARAKRSIAFALDKMISTLNSLFDGHLIPLYWSGVFSAVRLFPLFIILPFHLFKLSNKMALMKYYGIHSGGADQ